MSESGAPARIHGTGPKRMQLHEFFRWTARRRPKSDTHPRKTGVRSDTSDFHGGTRI
jgi:hypothetical protein